MQKQQFTPAGVMALQTELYMLSNVQLLVEVDDLQLNFKNWINTHLDLSAAQLNFLTELDPRAFSFLVTQTAIAVANRLSISLEKEPDDDDDKTGKVIKPKSLFTTTANSEGNVNTTGELIIQIYYQG